MSPKSVSYKGTDVKYNYYHCPTTKKRGCKDGVWFKEDELVQIVLKHCNDRINNLMSLDHFLQKVGADKVVHTHANLLEAKLNDEKHRLKQVREAQASLDEDKLNSVITEDECRSLRIGLIEYSDTITKSIKELTKEVEDILLYTNERLAWIKHFRQFDNINVLNRKMVVSLIHYIKIISKTEIEVHFNFEDEYETGLAIVSECGFDEVKE